ncbi:MAG: carbohydrate kinase [Candidatus Korobacteraceae bacterium]
MQRLRIVSVGEILFDVIDGTEYLGGAPLNFAAHAHKLGHEVFLVSGVGDDDRGRRALDSLRQHGISTEFVQVLSGKNTGTAEVELDLDGKPMFRIVRPAAYDFVELTAGHIERIAELQPHWIYFGTLFHISPQALTSTIRLLDRLAGVKSFYDVNLRDGNWNLATVEELARHANVIKLSDSEAEFLDASLNVEGHEGSMRHFCQRWSEQYRCKTVCVTSGESGCCLYKEGTYVQVPGFKVQVADTVGAGDAFAAALLHGLEQGWDIPHCGKFANAVGALVAGRTGAVPDWNVEEIPAMLGDQFEARTKR